MSKPLHPKNDTNIPSIEMIYVEGGTFQMGSVDDEDSQPIHAVTLPDFYLGKYPVTNEQFVPFLNEKGNQEEEGTEWIDLEGTIFGVRCGIQQVNGKYECLKGFEQHPLINVNWYGARAYCEWLSIQTGERFRLPSEAEWEYAARGGRRSKGFPYAGGHKLKEVGWYRKNSHGQTKPVGLKQPNELGLYDMSGNVWEWCADYWHDNYKGAPKDGSAWVTGGGTSRVLRGGSWSSIDGYCRVSVRFGNNPDYRNNSYGFRVAQD